MSIDTKVAIIFGIISAVLAILTVALGIITYRLQKRQYNKDLENVIRIKNFFEVYTTRDALTDALQSMYYAAEKGDTIWGQCVGCSNYFDNLHELLLKKSIEGVSFKVIINSKSDGELEKLFAPLDNAETKTCDNVKIRLHGLSDKQLIFSFKSVNGMAAIKVFDENLISIIRKDFEMRFHDL